MKFIRIHKEFMVISIITFLLSIPPVLSQESKIQLSPLESEEPSKIQLTPMEITPSPDSGIRTQFRIDPKSEPSVSVDEKTIKILILPFAVNAEKDMSFMKDGIMDMLSTRLTYEDKIIPIGKEQAGEAIKSLTGPIEEKTALTLGEKVGAKYVLFGSLTVIGSHISTDIRLVDTKERKTTMTFSETGQNPGEVISHVNRIAIQINDKLLGRKTEPPKAETASAPKPSVEESRRHPESLWNEAHGGKADAGGTILTRQTDDGGGFETEAVIASGAVWKSKTFEEEIISLTAGDTDADGKIETIFVSERKVFVYRHADGRFAKLAEIDGSASDGIISVDAGDINGNGKAEIFVTCLNKNSGMLQSFVLEWNGREYEKIADKSKWYFRVLRVPGKSDILIGQKRGLKDVFLGSVQELKWSGGDFIESANLGLPSWINVFGVIYGDFSGQELTVAFADNDTLRVLTRSGKEEWRSNEKYGGSSVYLGISGDSTSSSSNYKDKDTDRRYLSQRLLMADTNQDGKNEIIVVKNTDAASRLFARLRLFKSGHIECLEWDGIALTPKWKTKELTGYISDYVAADINNDGKNEVAFAVVSKSDSILSKAKSYIGIQAIPQER